MHLLVRFARVLILAAVVGCASCNRPPEKGDANLAGVWLADMEGRQRLLDLKADGTYECVVTPRTGVAQKLEGRWEIKDRVFTETMIRNSVSHPPVPLISRAKIVAWSEEAFSLHYEGATQAITFRRKAK